MVSITNGSKIQMIFRKLIDSYSFLSSKLVKEIYQLGGEVGSMVPQIVDLKLKEKFRSRK